jgi:hypothetical protein
MSLPDEAFSPAQLAQITTAVKAAVRDELADAGLRLDDTSHQDEAREDFRFVRKLRLGVNGMASKIGWTVIAAIVGAAIWIFSAGLNFWRGA